MERGWRWKYPSHRPSKQKQPVLEQELMLREHPSHHRRLVWERLLGLEQEQMACLPSRRLMLLSFERERGLASTPE